MRAPKEPILKLYVGQVVDNADPNGWGRVKAIVNELMGEVPLEWAWPVGSQMAGPLTGFFAPPLVGSNVTLGFQRGDIAAPLYWPGPWSAPNGVTEIPVAFQGQAGVEPTLIGWETRRYLFKLLDAAGGSGGLTIKDKETLAAFTIGSDGAVQLVGPEGRSVLLSPSGDLIQITDQGTGKIEMTGSKMIIEGGTIELGEGAGESVVLGDTFKTFLDAHIHPDPVSGNTGAPTIAMPASTLSTKVKAET